MNQTTKIQAEDDPHPSMEVDESRFPVEKVAEMHHVARVGWRRARKLMPRTKECD
jgi:hypothetical protein